MPPRKTPDPAVGAAQPAPPRKARPAAAATAAATSAGPSVAPTATPAPDPAIPAEPNQQPPASLPGSITAAAVLLLIFGTLAGLGTALMVLTMMAFSAIPFGSMPPMDCMSGDPFCDLSIDPSVGFETGFWFMGMASVALMAIVGAAVTGGHIAAGIAILQRRNWARILGMVISGAAIVVLVLGLGTTLTAAIVPMPPFDDPMGGQWDDYYAATMAATLAFGTVVVVFIGAAYAYVLWVLARRGEVFE